MCLTPDDSRQTSEKSKMGIIKHQILKALQDLMLQLRSWIYVLRGTLHMAIWMDWDASHLPQAPASSSLGSRITATAALPGT